jgi:predicted transcriptional regulator YdeE
MQIIEKEAFWVTGITVQAKWNELWEKMPKVWKEMFERYREIENRKEDVLLDISLEVKNDIYTQFIGTKVTGGNEDTPEGMKTVHIPAKNYIHQKHTGPLKEIATTFGEIYDWANKNNINTGNFKLDVGYVPSGDENYHDLYVEIEN